MIIVGIESTAHTFGVSITKGEEVLSNCKEAYTTTSGGMIPSQVAEHHINVCDKVFLKAINQAKITTKEINLIAYSQSPGLGHMLRIGASFAKSLALILKKPIIGVNHCIAHLEIGRIKGEETKKEDGEKSKDEKNTKKEKNLCSDPVMLYASGANTQIIARTEGKYRIFGETLDIGVGNFLDSFGRDLKLGFPAGPQIEVLAKKGREQKEELIELPYSVKGMDVSFGGIQTKIRTLIEQNKFSKEQLCMSVQETIFAMLVEVAERAMAHCDKKELVLGGGVACNKRLQEMCSLMCKNRDSKCYIPENQYLVDNAAMIAITGLKLFQKKNNKGIKIEEAGINPYKRTDEVDY